MNCHSLSVAALMIFAALQLLTYQAWYLRLIVTASSVSESGPLKATLIFQSFLFHFAAWQVWDGCRGRQLRLKGR